MLVVSPEPNHEPNCHHGAAFRGPGQYRFASGTHVPAVIISDSERALTAMDGHRAVVGSGAAELYCGPSGGANVVLANHLRKMFNQVPRCDFTSQLCAADVTTGTLCFGTHRSVR